MILIIENIVHLIHWIIYIVSFLAFGLLFSKWYKWGATFIGILFLVQVVFHGCPIVDLQNYFRVKEGLLPIQDGMLTDRFSNSLTIQLIISALISLTSFSILLFL